MSSSRETTIAYVSQIRTAAKQNKTASRNMRVAIHDLAGKIGYCRIQDMKNTERPSKILNTSLKDCTENWGKPYEDQFAETLFPPRIIFGNNLCTTGSIAPDGTYTIFEDCQTITTVGATGEGKSVHLIQQNGYLTHAITRKNDSFSSHIYQTQKLQLRQTDTTQTFIAPTSKTEQTIVALYSLDIDNYTTLNDILLTKPNPSDQGVKCQFFFHPLSVGSSRHQIIGNRSLDSSIPEEGIHNIFLSSIYFNQAMRQLPYTVTLESFLTESLC